LSPLACLRARVAARLARADDASEADLAVLERQIATREPLTPAEMAAAINLDASRTVSRRTWWRATTRLEAYQRRKALQSAKSTTATAGQEKQPAQGIVHAPPKFFSTMQPQS